MTPFTDQLLTVEVFEAELFHLLQPPASPMVPRSPSTAAKEGVYHCEVPVMPWQH